MDFIHAKLACRRADPAIIPKGFWDSDQNAEKVENDNKSHEAQTQVSFEL